MPPDTATSCTVDTAAAAQDLPVLEYEKYTLENGLEVVLHVDRVAAVRPIVNVGRDCGCLRAVEQHVVTVVGEVREPEHRQRIVDNPGRVVVQQ